MTPIKWNGTTEIVTTADDPEWYDYSQKKWANVKTADGSYWVWIPRYAYQITNGYHQGGEGISGTIEIKFLKGKTNEAVDGTIVETIGYEVGVKDTGAYYFKHPAFTFGDDELLGFWVAKFEPSPAPDT